MATRCDPLGCDEFFGPRLARRAAKRYRRRGLDKTVRRMVQFLEQRGVEGCTVLEIGGGVGEIGLELMKRGAERSVNLELSPAYEQEAEQLLSEAGLRDRAERRIHDIAVDPTGVEPADAAVLHRVVCCYPDYERLLTAVADRTRHVVIFSHPPRNALSRLVVEAQALAFRVFGKEFHPFGHPPSAMVAVLREAGLRLTFRHPGTVWQIMELER